MTAISEPFVPVVDGAAPRLGEWARWAALAIAFLVSGIALGCVAVIRLAG